MFPFVILQQETYLASMIYHQYLSNNLCLQTATIFEQPNGLRYPLVGGTRRRHFAGINFKPRKLPENAPTPTSRVHAVLGVILGVGSGPYQYFSLLNKTKIGAKCNHTCYKEASKKRRHKHVDCFHIPKSKMDEVASPPSYECTECCTNNRGHNCWRV